MRTLSDDDVRRLGLEPGRAPDDGVVESVDRETGEVAETPAGIGEGWDYAPGRSVDRALGRIASGAAERASSLSVAIAREYVQGVLGLDHFERWLARPDGHYPVAVLDDELARAIRAEPRAVHVRVVRMSDETARKQQRHHGELTPGEYRLLPSIVERGQVIQDGEQTVVVVSRERRLYAAAIKATSTGQALFLTSFRRVQEREIARLRKRGTLLREGS